ncbi:hypothetical protein [Spirosoma agri]|uniref:PE-PGRS family protein n=1 Tax=Spirosoma agri TaxID=1987381 RepID=A0A6M0IFU6_9BACT|nr:hypothetical protein [Spirosoma agri]NEU66221.1 hypothetical protein [Spirosoma agri]
MKFIGAVILVLMLSLNSCQPVIQLTGIDWFGSTASKSDGLPWVNYTADELTTDSTSFTKPQAIGLLNDPALTETSGMVMSQRNSGYFWTEEDSGNSNQIQLLCQDGQVMARFVVDGATNRDWEDMAIGAGPVAGVPYIYLADIGDNKHLRSEKIIYRFPEPTVAGQRLPYEGHITNAEIIHLKIPDGSQNAEAILVDSQTKDLFVLSKGDHSVVYRAAYPQSLTKPVLMTRELVLPFRDVTSAAVSPDGREILVRTYEQLFHYSRQADATITDALKASPRILPVAWEPQGEAVGWSLHGDGYYTTTEGMDNIPQVIHYYPRKR